MIPFKYSLTSIPWNMTTLWKQSKFIFFLLSIGIVLESFLGLCGVTIFIVTFNFVFFIPIILTIGCVWLLCHLWMVSIRDGIV